MEEKIKELDERLTKIEKLCIGLINNAKNTENKVKDLGELLIKLIEGIENAVEKNKEETTDGCGEL